MRLKFLLFALLVMGLWVGALAALSSILGQALVEQGGRQAEVAAAAAARSAGVRRALVLKVALAPLGEGAVVNAAAKGRTAEAHAKLFEAVRTAAAAATPEDVRGDLIVAFLPEGDGAEALVTRGPAGEEKVEGLDAAAVMKAGGEGAIVAVGPTQHQFASTPIVTAGLPEPRRVGTLAVGLPLLPARFAEGLVRELGLSTVKLLEGGKVVAEGGVKGAAAGAEKNIPLGSVGIVERGGSLGLGPIQLPLLTQGDVLGGSAPVAIASRQALQGTPFEVLAVVSLRPAMKGLAEAQQVAVLALAGLLVCSFVFMLLIGSGASAARGEREPMTDPALRAANKGEVLKLGFDASGANPVAPPAEPPPPEPSPDDFQFAPKPPSPPSSLELPPVPDSALPPPAGTAAADPFAAFDSDRAPTRAYPVAGEDPFGGQEQPADGEPFNPDATRVAAVSDELLRASARPSGEQPAQQVSNGAPPRAGMRAPAIPPPPPPMTNPGASPQGDEAHFQDVYREFVSTRERCGEAADGLTYEKFAAKLKKNREQLIQKYNCKTVRFQVYVKEGKAALKATPVKE